jgi:hypothetical protein
VLLNPLNADLNPIYHLLALLGAHPIFHISRIRVNVVRNRLEILFNYIFIDILPDLLFNLTVPTPLSLVGGPVSGNGCGSPNHI